MGVNPMAAYDYDRRVLATVDILQEYGLEGLRDGTPVTLYHGTTRLFRRFDLNQSRDDLVVHYYGRGIYLTPLKRIALAYANGNRNIGFPPSIIADFKRKNPAAGRFLEILCEHGRDGWTVAFKEMGFWRENPAPGEGQMDSEGFESYLGVDPNTVGDVAGYVIDSKVEASGGGSGPLGDLFGLGTVGAPDWVYDDLDKLGLNSKVYRPKVYTVSVRASNPLVTKSKSEAQRARSEGYDCLVFHGSDLVQGVPEVSVFDGRKVKIQRIEVV